MAARSPILVAYPAAAAVVVLCTFLSLSSDARADEFLSLSSSVQADCGGFAESCGSISVSAQGGLQSICSTDGGGYDRASMDLNAHISNDNGNLVDGGGFAASCRNIRWYQLGNANQGVAAECVKRDQSLGPTTLYNVQRRMANYNGILVWNNC